MKKIGSHIFGPVGSFGIWLDFPGLPFQWPKFMSTLPPLNTHPSAHRALAAGPLQSRRPHTPLSHMGVEGPWGTRAILRRNLLQCIKHRPWQRRKNQLSRWKVPGSEFAKFFKRTVVTGWWATFPWRMLCSWEAAIAVFQRLSYNWTMFEDV